MKQPSLFHKDISKPDYLDRLSADERATVERFVEDMQTGAPDGSTDGQWQGTGRGYYAHLEILESLADPREQDCYREQLRDDIEVWLKESPNNHMVLTVKERVFGGG
jgi:hypothetical protein